MKRAVLSLMLLSIALTAKGLKIEFKISKVHGLIRFIETIAGEPARSPVLKQHFEKSEFNHKVARSIVEEYHKLRPHLHTVIPSKIKQFYGISLGQLFQIKSAEVETIDQFEKRIRGILPIPVHIKYIALLKKGMPLYRQYIFDKAYPALNKIKTDFEKNLKKWNTQKLLRQYKIFYHSEWPESIPFVVSLIPLPGTKGTTNSQSIGYFESLSVFTGDPENRITPAKPCNNNYDVLIHEIAHSLYSMRSKELYQKLNTWFHNSKHPVAPIAYQYLNEGLATILGNGIAQAYTEKTFPKIPGGSWYNEPYIDGFAKALYPLTLNYIQNNKPIDQHYINQAIKLFGKTFPDAVNELAPRFQKITIIADGKPFHPQKLGAYLRKHFNISSSNGSAPLNHPITIKQLTNQQDRSMKIMMIHTKQLKQIDETLKQVPLLKALYSKISGKQNIAIGGFDQQNTPWILIIATDNQSLKRGIQKLKKYNKIPLETVTF